MTNIDYLSILGTLNKEPHPLGSAALGKKLNIPPATMGRYLKKAEDAGFVASVSNKGRVLTSKGSAYLQSMNSTEEKKKIAAEIIDMTEQNDHSLIEILRARLLIEPYMAARACETATEDDVIEIQEFDFEHMMNMRRGELGNEADLKFHLKLAKLAGNQMLERILKLLLTENDAYTEFSNISNAMNLQQLTRHTEIATAIKERNPEKAKEAMRTHLTLLIENAERIRQG